MQTTSPGLSQKIKKFNLIIEHIHCWRMILFNGKPIYILEKQSEMSESFPSDHYFPAYSLGEILEVLPEAIKIPCPNISNAYHEYRLQLCKNNSNYLFAYHWEDGSLRDFYNSAVYYKNPAEAAGQLLVWCVENGYVEL